MAKLSREQAEEAIRLKEEGLGYRKIEEKLKEKHGDANVPTFSNINIKLKPILEGEKTLDEVFSEEDKKEPKKKPSSGDEELEVGFEGGVEEDSSQNSNIVLVILWILFIILVAYFTI